MEGTRPALIAPIQEAGRRKIPAPAGSAINLSATAAGNASYIIISSVRLFTQVVNKKSKIADACHTQKQPRNIYQKGL